MNTEDHITIVPTIADPQHIDGVWLDGTYRTGLITSYHYLKSEGFSMGEARAYIESLPKVKRADEVGVK